jgi:hypothetical protein
MHRQPFPPWPHPSVHGHKCRLQDSICAESAYQKRICAVEPRGSGRQAVRERTYPRGETGVPYRVMRHNKAVQGLCVAETDGTAQRFGRGGRPGRTPGRLPGAPAGRRARAPGGTPPSDLRAGLSAPGVDYIDVIHVYNRSNLGTIRLCHVIARTLRPLPLQGHVPFGPRTMDKRVGRPPRKIKKAPHARTRVAPCLLH